MNPWRITCVGAGLIALTGMVFVLSDVQTPTLFSSFESKTINGQPVFNRIKFIPGWNRDVWLMQQSHMGLDAATNSWDRLAILVEKGQSDYRSRFLQFKPGGLTLEQESETTQLRAPCFACHANGPRAIRPDPGDPLAANLRTKIRIFLLNLRVKSYGPVVSELGARHPGTVPFKQPNPELEQALSVESCQLCHREGGLRQPLKLAHWSTVKFMVDHQLMPPWPFSISPQDRQRLDTF